MKIKFIATDEAKKSKSNKVFVFLPFEGGDADTEHIEEWEIKGVKFSEWNNHAQKIENEVNRFKKLSKILDVNSSEFLDDYDEIKEKHGEEIANLFDNTPNDPQNDYQNKCHLPDYAIKLVGYNEEGWKFESYIK